MPNGYRTYLLIAAMTVSNLFWIRGTGEGFNDESHRNLSQRAVDPTLSTYPSILDIFLRTTLGFEFPDGINTALQGGADGTVRGRIQFGAVREDAGLRVRNHFHNPRLPWNLAGMGLPFTASSIVWAQNPSQLSFDKRSWQDARNYYFQALTATSDSERKRLYAETFRTLGHQIHHVQDAATPAHTRNDWHLSLDWFGGGPNPDEFHYWAERLPGQAIINASDPLLFNTALLNQSSANSNAPIPIARIIDFNDGDVGTLALTPGITMGLAEYSSANFFSDDTINSPNFLSPRSNQVEVKTEDDLSIPPKRRPYVYIKAGVGDTSYRLALASAMLPYVIDPLATPTENGLDDKVFQGYGIKLFPRAIGYSAGLIDYFFRGNMSPDSNYHALYPISNPPTTMTIGVVNNTPNEDTGNGTLNLLLRYCCQTNTDEIFPQYVISKQVSQNVTRSIQNVAIPFNSAIPVPATIGPVCDPTQLPVCQSTVGYYVLLVYRGPLGGESDAVIVTKCGVLINHARYTNLSEGVEVFINCGGDS